MTITTYTDREIALQKRVAVLEVEVKQHNQRREVHNRYYDTLRKQLSEAQAEVTRLEPLQFRQAPCHKFCEATAFEIEIRNLKKQLAEAQALIVASRKQEPPTVEFLTDKIASMLGLTYHCTRVWSAWRVGTMGEDDFEPVDESDTPREIAEEIIKLFAAPVVVQDLPTKVENCLWFRNGYTPCEAQALIEASRKQEPVATVEMHPDGRRRTIFKDSVTDCDASWKEKQKLYAAPVVAPDVQPMTKEKVRAAGGIVHSDGNVFFTSLDQLNAAMGGAND